MTTPNRVQLYCPRALHRRLKAALAREGKPVSQWFREQAQKFVDRKER